MNPNRLADNKADLAMVSERIDIAVSAAETAGRKMHEPAPQVRQLRKDQGHPDNQDHPRAVALGRPSPKVTQIINAFKRAATDVLLREQVGSKADTSSPAAPPARQRS